MPKSQKKLREEAAARKKEQERIVRDKEPEKSPRVIIAQPTSTIEAQTIANAINAM
jgi:hypothetical protein